MDEAKKTQREKRVSIALAVYNGGKYLKEQIESLMCQTMPFDELVICDDCSVDDSVAIIETYSAKDPRIKLFRNDENLGFRRNFEKALSLCRGDYIALCDQDDIWTETHIATLLGEIGDSMLVAGGSELIDSEGNRTGQTLAHMKNFDRTAIDNIAIFKFVVYYQNPFQGASMMLQREFLQKALPIPSNVKYHDVWFTHMALLMNGFRFIKTPVTYYRIHGENASGSHQHRHRIRTFAGHLLHPSLTTNRCEVVSGLSTHRHLYGEKECRALDEAIRYYSSRSISQRVENLIFELKNFNEIYGKDNV